MRKLVKNLILSILWRGVTKKMRQDKPRIIAIAGSVGKTSTKEAIAEVLKTTGRPVLKTIGNLGTEVGIPLSLLGFNDIPGDPLSWLGVILTAIFPPILDSEQKPYYVLEFASDKPGDIAYLAKRLPPDLVIATQVAPAHLEHFTNLDEFVAEELALFSFLKPDGYAVLNADDPYQRELDSKLPRVIWYGLREEKPSAHQDGVWMHHLEMKEKGLKGVLEVMAKKRMDTIGHGQPQTMPIQTSLLGKHQLYPLAAAAAVGFQEKATARQIQKTLENYQVPPGRGRLIAGSKEISIIDDSYNSSPEAVKAGLLMLKPYAKKRRVVAILGQMNELGEQASNAHFEVGKAAAGRVDFLVAVGAFGEKMLEGAKEAGMSAVQMIHFLTPEQLIDKMEQIVQRNDVVYVKASQNGMRLERVVKKIMANPNQAKKLLVRQEGAWSKL